MIYLDNAATTPVDRKVIDAMKPFFDKVYGNPASIHSLGEEAHNAVEQSRERILKKVNGNGKLIFTSGGTESNNLAIKGMLLSSGNKRAHLITTKIEHECVLKAAKWAEKLGFSVTYLPVDENGFVRPEDVENAIREETVLVSVMHANNEIGTVEPIEEIAKICKEHGVYFHTDACQSFCKQEIDVKKMNIDLMTINAHKIYGPKGVGGLYIAPDIKIEPLLHGGGQEFGIRSGTLNVPGIVGFGAAVEVIKKSDVGRMKRLRDYLLEELLKIDDTMLNGPRNERLCNNVNIIFRFIEGESIVLLLSEKGIYTSTGSACSSRTLEPNHVLLAIGRKPEDAHGSVRFSLGKNNTKEEMAMVIQAMHEIVLKLRKISPVRW